MPKMFEVPAVEEEKGVENNPPSEIARYWRKFSFPGTPPREGTPVEKRLLDISRKYFEQALSCERKKNSIGSSAERRELHNQLSLMIIGKQRSDIDLALAEKIADFASYLVNGQSMNVAIREILDFEKNKQYD
jgi:hypothetical protein